MTRTLSKLTMFLSVLVFFLTGMEVSPAVAQDYVRIQNRWKPNEAIHTESGNPTASAAQPGWHSADWNFELTNDPNVYFIRNRYRGTALVFDLTSTPKQGSMGSPNAAWSVTRTPEGFYQIGDRNGRFLHVQNGVLQLGDIQPGWWSAQWTLPGFERAIAAARRPDAYGERMGVRVAPPVASGPPRPFAQCVRNVFGSLIIARVKWYNPATVTVTPGAATNDPNTYVDETMPTLALSSAEPVREDVVPVFQESCISGVRPHQQPYLAIISVDGARYLNRISEVGIGITGGLAGAFYCASHSVESCQEYYRRIRGLFTGRMTVSGLGADAAREVFYVGTPGMLDVKGQVSSPEFQETSPVQ